MAEWDGVIFLRQGIYSQGVFRFHLVIPANFPGSEPPRVFFLSNVFHPSVDPATNELDVERSFPTWRCV